MSGKFRIDVVDDALLDVLLSKGYQMDGRSLTVDIEDIEDILDCIDDEEELEFDDHED